MTRTTCLPKASHSQPWPKSRRFNGGSTAERRRIRRLVISNPARRCCAYSVPRRPGKISNKCAVLSRARRRGNKLGHVEGRGRRRRIQHLTAGSSPRLECQGRRRTTVSYPCCCHPRRFASGTRTSNG